jgi:hypothetical protein
MNNLLESLEQSEEVSRREAEDRIVPHDKEAIYDRLLTEVRRGGRGARCLVMTRDAAEFVCLMVSAALRNPARAEQSPLRYSLETIREQTTCHLNGLEPEGGSDHAICLTVDRIVSADAFAFSAIVPRADYLRRFRALFVDMCLGPFDQHALATEVKRARIACIMAEPIGCIMAEPSRIRSSKYCPSENMRTPIGTSRRPSRVGGIVDDYIGQRPKTTELPAPEIEFSFDD